MVEPIMFFGLGFLAASLIGLIIVPFVHGRAVRLTVRRLEAATPLSMAEIQADKDQLRADFAMSTRRLEMSVDQLKGKSTGQLAELGKKNDTINRLKIELGEKAATIFSLEARERASRISCARPRTSSRSRPTRCARPSAISRTRKPSSRARPRNFPRRPRSPTASASRSSRSRPDRRSQGPGFRSWPPGQGYRRTISRARRKRTRKPPRNSPRSAATCRTSAAVSAQLERQLATQPAKPRSSAAASPTWRRG